jgi:tetratricopeptide (TPR) repeat protein
MGSLKLWSVTMLGAVAAVAALAGVGVTTVSPPTADDLVVHEWGTFLAMNGSDGVALDGMYHEEHALPAFVHARSRDQLRLPSVILKGETPVIYFYTDRPQKARVDVRFPRGHWTQWYPQAQVVGPQLSQAASPIDPRDGRIVWCAEIIPAGEKAPLPPRTGRDALWNFAREVDAAYVRTPDRTKPHSPTEAERFLFYRGLGRAPLPVSLTAEHGGTLAIGSDQPHGAAHVFILRVEGGRGAYTYRPALGPGERRTEVIPTMRDAQPLERFTDRISEDLRRCLVQSGLFDKEARAMVNTWRTSYFQNEGIRALFVLPQEWTDAFIPLEITPRPREVRRVMVGRIELLTPERERLAETAIGELASPEAAVRERAFNVLRDQGRYVEPIMRRVLRTTRDETIRAACRRLLATDFVTELRAAVHNAADGSRVLDDPVFVRAQLASLLRAIGRDAEAKAEGKAALTALDARPAPPLSDPDSRQYLRAYARAQEGLGDDPGAARTYARFIRFASQVRTKRDCRGCHRDAGPQDMAWFRDWWAGQRYADLTARTGQADRAIAEHEAALAGDPANTAARMMLAYLREAKGEPAQAQKLWADLTRPEPNGLAALPPGR